MVVGKFFNPHNSINKALGSKLDKKFFISIGVLFISGGALWAESPKISLTRDQVEAAALQNSPQLDAIEKEWRATEEKAASFRGPLYPKLSLDASYRYVTEVPTFKPVPLAPAIPFGDHKNYSFGPALNWMAWDSGAIWGRAKAATFQARAKQKEWESLKRKLILEARLDYFQIQLLAEQVWLLTDSLKLAEAEAKDISIKYKAGSVSRIDLLSSSQEVISRQRDLRQAEADLATGLRSLFSETNLGKDIDPSYPVDSRAKDGAPAYFSSATVILSLDPIDQKNIWVDQVLSQNFDENNPSLEALSESIKAAQKTVDVLNAGHGPSVQVMAKISRDYPNGPVLESFNQKMVSVVASLPLFEGGRVTHDVRSQKETADEISKKKEQVSRDLLEQWNKARDLLKGYVDQAALNQKSVEQAKELAKLVYESYKAGQSNFIEVESANLKLLQTQVLAARTQVQMLIQKAVLDSLTSSQ